ncbi:hypothetical protein [Fructilactobacillus florum]|uniref:dUTPase n=1 Tax=Fructilactobacillus florum DSM 22689 = JCM 16035 TaxID=1423745 RepID=A0A0R2CJH9_9LACO|nr:hypothetical protein [Fructilactobacillus florum]EKK20711.1 dUTPase [Fructilactobacillus florum 2F]KRM91805.1 hypothetical protein FC87_GL000630 [Fructilactobacillus florum DSM 22689 = JCM 16035]
MEFEKLQTAIINYYRTVDTKQQRAWGTGQHLAAALFDLDLNLADFAKTKRLGGGSTNSGRTAKQAYLEALKTFVLLATLLHWNQQIQLSSTGLAKIQQLPVDDNPKQITLYLAIKNMLLKAYYQHDQDCFQHAWQLFLKWGLVDDGYQPEALVAELLAQVTEKTAQMVNHEGE